MVAVARAPALNIGLRHAAAPIPRRRWAKEGWNRFSQWLSDSPKLGNSFLYTVYGAAGVFTVQTLEQWNKNDDVKKIEESTTSDETTSATDVVPEVETTKKPTYCWSVGNFDFDMARVAGMMVYAAVFNGPINSMIYPWYVKTFGAHVNLAIIFDQLIYMPFWSVPSCWHVNGLTKKVLFGDEAVSTNLVKDKVSETQMELSEKWVANVKWTMLIWFPTEAINMRYIPVHLRAPVSGMASFIWLTGMAFWTHVVK